MKRFDALRKTYFIRARDVSFFLFSFLFSFVFYFLFRSPSSLLPLLIQILMFEM